MNTITPVPLGSLVATPTIVSSIPGHQLRSCIRRHRRRDWGDVCESDAKLNDEAMEHGGRLISAYNVKDNEGDEVKIWLITEADRSATTILYPSEY